MTHSIDAILRFGVAFVYSLIIFGHWKKLEKNDANELEEALEADALRDNKSPAENLLPLRRTHVSPVTLLTETSIWLNIETFVYNLIGSKLNDTINLYYDFAIVALQCAGLISAHTQELSYTNDSETSTFLILNKTLQLVAISLSFWQQKSTFLGMKRQNLVYFLLVFLLTAEWIEKQSQPSRVTTPSDISPTPNMDTTNPPKSSKASLLEQNSSKLNFSLSYLTVYLFGVAIVFKLARVFNRAKLWQTTTDKSQAIVNRLASVMFQETKQNIGYAILQMNAVISPLEENKDLENDTSQDQPRIIEQLTLLRFNQRFEELLKAAEGDDATKFENNQQELEVELGKKELTHILLDNYKINKLSVAGESDFANAQNADYGRDSNDNTQTFKSYMLRALKNFRPYQQKSGKHAFAPVLFEQNFFFDDIAHLRRGQGLQQLNLNGLEITVQLLCSESSMFLVKANRLTLARLQIPLLRSCSSQDLRKSENKSLDFTIDNDSIDRRQERFPIRYSAATHRRTSRSMIVNRQETISEQNQAPNNLLVESNQNLVPISCDQRDSTLQSLHVTPSQRGNRRVLTNMTNAGAQHQTDQQQHLVQLIQPSLVSPQMTSIQRQIISTQNQYHFMGRHCSTYVQNSNNSSQQDNSLVNEKDVVQQSSWDERQRHNQNNQILQRLDDNSGLRENQIISTNGQNNKISDKSQVLSNRQMSYRFRPSSLTEQHDFRFGNKGSSSLPSESDTVKAKSNKITFFGQSGNNINMTETQKQFNSLSLENFSQIINGAALSQSPNASVQNTELHAKTKNYSRINTSSTPLRFMSQKIIQNKAPISSKNTHNKSAKVRNFAGSDLIGSPMSGARSQKTTDRVKNNRIFIYKIIHDFNHPTQAVCEGLKKLCEETKDSKLTNGKLLGKNKLKYVGHPRILLALKWLQEFTGGSSTLADNSSRNLSSFMKPKQSSKSQMVGFSSLGKKISKNKCSSIQEPDNSFLLDDSSIHGKNKRSHSQRKRGNIRSQKLAPMESSSLLDPLPFSSGDNYSQKKLRQISPINQPPQSKLIKNEEEQPEAYEVIAAAQNAPADISQVIIQKKDFGTSPLQQQQNVLVKDLDVIVEVKNDSSNMLPQNKNQSLSSQNESSSIELSSNNISITDGISEGIIEEIDMKPVMQTQHKQLGRKNTIDLILERQSLNQQQPKAHILSLAMERQIQLSKLGRKFQHSGQEPKKGLSNVLQVIEQFHQQAQQLNNSQQSDEVPRLIRSMENNESGSKKEDQLQHSSIVVKSSSDEKQLSPLECGVVGDVNIKELFTKKIKQKPSRSVSLNSSIANSADKSEHESNQNFSITKLRRLITIVLKERRLLISLTEGYQKRWDTMKRQLQNIQGQSEMMTTLMRDLMNQAQLNNNTFTVINEYFNLTKLVKKCMHTLSTQSMIKKIHLLGPILQNPLDKFYFMQIFGDENRYGQIILNFLSNGIKFTPTNGVVSISLNVTEVRDINIEDGQQDRGYLLSDSSCQSAPDKEILEDKEIQDPQLISHNYSPNQQPVSLQQNEQNSNLHLNASHPQLKEKLISFDMTFRDSGIGISPENQNRLFMNFSKLYESREQNKQGVGLGLSICKEIIKTFGGTVNIVSDEGRGTDFIISLQTKCRVDETQLRQAQANFDEFGIISTKQSKGDSSSHTHSSSLVSNSVHESIRMQLDLSEVSEDHQESQSDNSPITKINKKPTHQRKSKTTFESLEKKGASKRLGLISNPSQNSRQRKSLFTIIEKTEGNASPACPSNITRVLIANDNPFLLDSFSDGFAQHFDKVDTAENGQQVVQKVRSQSRTYYTAIILDINMPIMDGIQAFQEIRPYLSMKEEQKHHAPIRQNSSLVSASGGAQHMQLQPEFSSLQRPIPYIYALTSESELESLDRLLQVGFKAVYQSLNQTMMQEIIENAGYEFTTAQQHQISPQLNSEQSSSSVSQSIYSVSDSSLHDRQIQGAMPEIREDEEERKVSYSERRIDDDEQENDSSSPLEAYVRNQQIDEGPAEEKKILS